MTLSLRLTSANFHVGLRLIRSGELKSRTIMIVHMMRGPHNAAFASTVHSADSESEVRT